MAAEPRGTSVRERQRSREDPIWSPSPERIESSNLTRFARRPGVRAVGDHATRAAPIPMAKLHAWSVSDPAAFWAELWDFCGVRASHPPAGIVDDPGRMPGARWFEGARLDFAENLLAGAERTGAASDREALVSWNEEGRVRSLTWDELRDEVARFAAGLRRMGVRPGDRVAGFLPNIPEAVIAMLASSSLGAVWSSCSPDFGLDALVDRFGQIEPVVLVCAPRALWGGRWFDTTDRIRALAEQLPSLRAVVIAEYGGGGRAGLGGHAAAGGSAGATPGAPGATLWRDFVENKAAAPALDFAQLPFDHPLYILYSSGTTGLPKCIVHGQGGTLVQHLKELVLHSDLKPGDRILYQTTCGWMMWNWMVSALAVGATVVLYDGSPFHPDPTRLWDLVDAERLTLLGTGAKYLSLAETRGLEPRATHDLGSLRTLLSTGSPLLPGSFDWVYGKVKTDLHLASISGGTDIVSCFVLGDPTGPVHRGEIQSAGLGMRVEVWDEAGEPLPPGRAGELVCTLAFPSMPIGFWDDPGDERYRAAYFEHFDRPVWRHGDWIERTERGGFVIHGRSDATLNPGGVRIGTAEIYRPIEGLPEILESVAVGQEWEGDVRIVLFVVLRDDAGLDDVLRERIRGSIRAGASPRHVPAKIVQVPAVPRTLSGKVSEIAVRCTIHGLPVENLDALANPEALEHFRKAPEIED